jgi:hypothetical protein
MRLQRERVERLMKAAEIATAPEPKTLIVIKHEDGTFTEGARLVPQEEIDAIRPEDLLLVLRPSPEGLPSVLGIEGHGFIRTGPKPLPEEWEAQSKAVHKAQAALTETHSQSVAIVEEKDNISAL